MHHRRDESGIEIDDNGLDGGNGLLDRRDLCNLPLGDRPGSVHQCNGQVPTLLLELDEGNP